MQTRLPSRTGMPARSGIAWIRITLTCSALGALAACAAKQVAPAPAAAPAVAAPPSWLSCPGPADGSSILVNAIEEAHRAWTADSSTKLPPACVFSAFARVVGNVTDSVNDHAVTLAAAARRRGAEEPDLLAADIVLLAHARRYADVSRTYDRLAALNPQPPIEIARLAIAAARQRPDTASLLRLLSKTMKRPEAGPAMGMEYNVVHQTRQLWAAINEARGMLRQNPRYVVAYPSLVANFGTLGLADSVVAVVRRALAARASRSSVSSSLQSLVNTMLRHASLYGSTYGWDPVIADATRVDSALSTTSTKFLVAALILHAAEPRTREISAQIGTTGLSPSMGAAAAQERDAGCKRLPAVAASLNLAEARLRAGGDKYASGVPQVRAGLRAAREKVASMQTVCSRSGV